MPIMLANSKAKKEQRFAVTDRDCGGIEVLASGADEDKDGEYLWDECVSSLP